MEALIIKYRAKVILLDSNPLLLLLVRLADSILINDFKRTKDHEFTESEFSLLDCIVKGSSKIVATPHILTEASNLIFKLSGEKRQSVLGLVTKSIQVFKERRPEAKKLVQSGAFLNLGLIVSAIFDLTPKNIWFYRLTPEWQMLSTKRGVTLLTPTTFANSTGNHEFSFID